MNPQAFHERPSSAEPPARKRRRRLATSPATPAHRDMMDIEPSTPSSVVRLQDLPQELIKQIISHLLTPHLDSPSQLDTPLRWLQEYSHLRTLASVFRDALDTSVTSLKITSLPAHSLASFIFYTLPRFTSLHTLTIYPNSLMPSLFPAWNQFFSTLRPPSITSLTYVALAVDAALPSPLPDLFASALSHSLDTLSTTSMPLLAAFATLSSTLTSLELLMDSLDPHVLSSFPKLRNAKLLYRTRISQQAAQQLVTAFSRCNPELRVVELRLNYLPTSALDFIADIPRLSKLSLFDGEVDNDGHALQVLGRCAFLENLQLEWIKGLTGEHLEKLAETMGGRLKSLRIWNCEDVNDKGLEAVATSCPDVEVELRFERDQFHSRTLAMFGDRVSWGSYAL